MTNRIALSEVLLISQILLAHGFVEDEGEYTYAIDRFGEMLARMSQPERTLVTQLTSDLLVMRYAQYEASLHRIVRSIPAALSAGVEEVILVPLSETKSDGTPKSPSVMLYPAEQKCKYLPAFSGKRVRCFERLALVPDILNGRQSTLFLFLDDFIGTGSTAKLTIEHFRKTIEREGDRFMVVALVAQERGLEELAAEGIPYAVDIRRTRGISDSTTLEDRPAALNLVDLIEANIGVAPDYRRGYKRSEALVKMIRCPDNTFPLFWNRGTAGNWPAPFPR